MRKSTDQWPDKSGGIFCGNPYVHWSVGESTALLDGNFTPQELRFLAEFMERNYKEPTHA